MSLLIKTDSECDFQPIELTVSVFAVSRKERASEQDMQGLKQNTKDNKTEVNFPKT